MTDPIAERAARDEALREEGRQKGLREATLAAAKMLRKRAAAYVRPDRPRDDTNTAADMALRAAAAALVQGEHMKEGA